MYIYICIYIYVYTKFIDNSIISDSRRQSPTNKPVWANYSTDQKQFTGHMFNIKLEENPYKMNFKAIPVKIQWSRAFRTAY